MIHNNSLHVGYGGVFQCLAQGHFDTWRGGVEIEQPLPPEPLSQYKNKIYFVTIKITCY